MSKQTKQSS